MKSIKHWNARYIRDRIFNIAYEKAHPHDPWLTPTAVSILSSWLRPTDIGFEWGSGRSTIWFARRCAHLTSVEHSEPFFEKLRSTVHSEPISGKVSYFLCKDRSEYVSKIENTARPDFILVDGRWRDECAIRAIAKLKHGGLLVIDNANWYLPSTSNSPDSRRAPEKGWEEIYSVLSNWRSIWTTNGVTDTALWVKS
jgi:predicted O-methyltransferase YrrM